MIGIIINLILLIIIFNCGLIAAYVFYRLKEQKRHDDLTERIKRGVEIADRSVINKEVDEIINKED